MDLAVGQGIAQYRTRTLNDTKEMHLNTQNDLNIDMFSSSSGRVGFANETRGASLLNVSGEAGSFQNLTYTFDV